MQDLVLSQINPDELVTRIADRVTENILRILMEEPLLKDSPKPEEDLLTVDQAAAFLDLSKPTIYTKVSRGELPHLKNGNRLYFSKKELLAHLKEGGKKSHAEIESEADKYLSKNHRNQ